VLIKESNVPVAEALPVCCNVSVGKELLATTLKVEYGVEVPIPTLPELRTVNSEEVPVFVELAIARSGCTRSEGKFEIDNLAKGLDVPMPKLPPFETVRAATDVVA